MRITTILGSPRRNGNTAAVLSSFEALIGPPHLVERINVADYAIKGCLGCDACFRVPDAPGCVQRDDAGPLLERLIGSDVIVYAAPVYVWCFPAQMKALLDRHYSLVKWADGRVVRALLQGRRAALLVTCGGSAERNADLIQAVFRREMDYLGCEIAGMHVVPDCTIPEELGERGRAIAREMWREITRR